MKTISKYLIVFTVCFLFSCNEDDNELIATPSIADIFEPANSGIKRGTSTLIRNENNLQVQFETSNLIPNHAYTLWWVIWNKPENCTDYPEPCLDTDFTIADKVEVEFLYANGLVADSNGDILFTATLNENDNLNSINASVFEFPEFGGLQDAQKAEVHFILRSHGPAVDGIINQRISTFGGGCSTNLPPFTDIPNEVGECSEIQFSIHQVK